MPVLRLDAARVRDGLDADALFGDVRVVESTGSTNADLIALATEGAAEGVVVTTDHQTAGRGRLSRTWETPAGVGLATSVLVRPAVPRARWPWLPLMAGVAVVDTLADFGVNALLKWPNDVLVDDRKLAGILVEVADHGRAAIVGIGINVADVPASVSTTAISLAEALAVRNLSGGSGGAGAGADPTAVLLGLLRHLGVAYERWTADGGAVELSAAYLEYSGTVGRPVALTLPGGDVEKGVARGIDASGALMIDTDDGPETYAAGDVEHLR